MEIFIKSKGWLLNKIKNGIKNHDEYVFETLDVARYLNISTKEFKLCLFDEKNDYIFRDLHAYKVGGKYYFLAKDLFELKSIFMKSRS